MDVPFDLWGQRGGAGIDIASESPYADAIREVLGTNFRAGGSELMLTARLVPEPWNQDAVAIRVGERHVGHLPPSQAIRYAPVLSRLVAAGWAPQVAARLRAAADHQGLTASVWVDLAEPHLIAPINRPPAGACRLLPPGVAIPVITDGDLPPAPGEGDCWVYVTLHELVEPLPRGSRSVLRVCLDGVVIGRLTPRMSAELLPAVRRLAAGHQLTAARGLRTASGSQPELIVHAARSHELPELWLDSIAPDVTAVAARPFAPQAAGEAEPGNARPAGTPAPLYSPPPVGIAASLHGSAVGTARNGDSVVDHGSAGHWDRIDASKPPAGLRRSAPVPGGRHDPGIEDGADGRRRLVPIRREAGPAPIANGVYRAAARTPIPADAAVPPPPAGVRFAAPPGWPPPPPGWTPPAGWRPDPAWPPAPADWQWWVPYWD